MFIRIRFCFELVLRLIIKLGDGSSGVEYLFVGGR